VWRSITCEGTWAHFDPLLIRQANKCYEVEEGIPAARLTELRQGMANMWKGMPAARALIGKRDYPNWGGSMEEPKEAKA
jgi:hypothetical protein